MNEKIICDKCNCENDGNSKFCSNCGVEIVKNEVASNSIYCSNCGVQNSSANSFCISCGASLKNSGNSNNKNESKDDKKKGNIICIVSVILLIVPFLLPYILLLFLGRNMEALVTISSLLRLSYLLPLCSIIALVYGRIVYPKNVALKVVMWVYISLFILGFLGYLTIVAFCYSFTHGLG